MKKLAHIEEAERIGANSWDLQNFHQLPRTATAAQQVEALKADLAWQRRNHDEAARAISKLIADVEATHET